MSFKKTGSCTVCGASCSPRAKRCFECERLSRIGMNVGADNPGWRGGRSITQAGYVRVKRIGHPAADASGNVLEHRIVAEETVGRFLRRSEHVHHINGDKADNRPENLQVVSPAKHREIHSRLSTSEIHRLLGEGLTATEIARTYRVSWRRVARVRDAR